MRVATEEEEDESERETPDNRPTETVPLANPPATHPHRTIIKVHGSTISSICSTCHTTCGHLKNRSII